MKKGSSIFEKGVEKGVRLDFRKKRKKESNNEDYSKKHILIYNYVTVLCYVNFL